MKKAIKILGCIAGALLTAEGLLELTASWLWRN